MDLKKFLPPYFREHVPTATDGDEKPAVNKANKSSWMVAWDRSKLWFEYVSCSFCSLVNSGMLWPLPSLV